MCMRCLIIDLLWTESNSCVQLRPLIGRTCPRTALFIVQTGGCIKPPGIRKGGSARARSVSAMTRAKAAQAGEPSGQKVQRHPAGAGHLPLDQG